MKKAFFITVLFTFLAGSIFAASLKVLQPNGGEELRLGQAYQIKWTATGVGQKVKLVLMRHGGKVGIIDDELDAGSSPYNWTVGQYHVGTATAGEGYQIRVRTMDDEVQDFSDGFFSLVGGASANLEITSPNGGEDWPLGEKRQITWKTDLKNGTVDISLEHNGSVLGAIASGYPLLAKTLNWNAGDMKGVQAPADGGYKIRIKAVGIQVEDASDSAFRLSAQPAGTVKILKPSAGESICRGRFYQGQWQTTGAITQLELVAWINGQWRRLEGPFANSGSIQYAVPADSLPGAYRLRLQTLDAACFAEVSIQVADCGPSTYPDLTVTGARYEGGVVKATVKNLGESYTGPLCLRPDIPAFGQIKDHIYPVRTIEKNGESICSISVPVWPGIECLPGSVEVDPKHAIVEGNEENNRFSGQICNPAVQVDLPDFRIKSFSLASHPPSKYLIELANDGGEFKGQVRVRVIAMDKLSGGELTYDKTVSTCYETFAARSTYGFIAELVTLEDYPGVCSGAFGLVVDPDREIAEANEGNNGFEKSFFARDWGGNWRAIHPAEVRIGKANLWPLPSGGTIVLPFEDVNVSVPLRNCCSKGMNHQVIFRFDGSEIARFESVYLNSGASKALLFAIHVARTSAFKPLEIFVLNEIDSQMVAGKVPDFKAQVRVD